MKSLSQARAEIKEINFFRKISLERTRLIHLMNYNYGS